jgi:TRAP-type C4-dicarboxylate transport system permease small subunit
MARRAMLRRLLDLLYDSAAYLAAFFLVGTLVMVVLGIVARLGNWFIAGTDSYAGYCMAACGFLALAHTLKHNAHIRVTLVLEHAGTKTRRALELWALALATLLAGAFAWYSARLTFQSWQFNDISTGNDATPLWIPQLAMAFGTLVLLVALIDELVLEWRGRRKRTVPTEALHNE